MEIQETRGSANVVDIVKFGNYQQTANGNIQPIEWQVLAKEENKMLLLSKYCLDCKRFDVISNEQIFDIWKIVLNGQRYKDFESGEIDYNILCGDFADAIIKSSLFKNSFDNLSCIVVVFNLNNYNLD